MELGSPGINASFGKFQQLLGANAGLPVGLVAGGGQACTAHPHVDSNTGRLALFTYRMQAQVCVCAHMLAAQAHVYVCIICRCVCAHAHSVPFHHIALV